MRLLHVVTRHEHRRFSKTPTCATKNRLDLGTINSKNKPRAFKAHADFQITNQPPRKNTL